MNRGEIWTVNLDPGFGREIHKKRPALIISKDIINQSTASVIVIPISSQVPKIIGPEMIVIGKEAGVEKLSVLLPLFIRSIDQERMIKKIGLLNKDIMLEVEKVLKLIFEIP